MKKHITLIGCLLLLVVLPVEAQYVFFPRGVGGGGALFFPRINPANNDEFYVSCDMSEMFHSTDYGNSYTQLPFTSLQSLNVSTYEFTNNPLIAYSNFNDGNNGYPVKTADHGATWVMLPGYDASQGQVYAMKANYNNPNQLLMDYYGKIVFSANGGTTFTTVATATSSGVGLVMGGVFITGDSIYIGTNQGIYYSVNGGTSFSLMTTTGLGTGQVIWQFAGAKVGTTLRFACIASAASNVYNGLMPWDYTGLVAGVYTMDNASGAWVNKTGTINTSNDYVMYLAMAENDINTIYLGGKDNALGGPLVYKTTNAGTSWTKVFNTTGNLNIITGWEGAGGDKNWSWGETTFGISVAPNNSSRVIFGSFSDVHLSSDGGTTWRQAYVDNADQHPLNASTPTGAYYHSIGLENTTCWQVHKTRSGTMLGAFSDIGGIKSVDGGITWGFTASGLNMNSVYRYAETPGGTLFAGTSGIHDMYQSTRLKDAQLDAADANGKIMYSTNDGANWSLLHSFGHPVFWLAIDPNDSNKMYASVINSASVSGSQGGIWVTSNLNSLSASTWTHIANPPRTEGHPTCLVVLNDGKLLATYSGHINTSSAFTASSGVFLYDPSTSTWTDVSDPGMHYWTKDIVVDPNDATQNTWYACVFTHWGSTASGQGGLYKTTNRGLTWTKITGTTFSRVTSISFNPLYPNIAFLTTETQGLWQSTNMSAATPSWNLVVQYPFRQPERVFFNFSDLWVTSFGNGMKQGYIDMSTSLVKPVADALNIYPNPVTGILNIDLPSTCKPTPVEIFDLNARLITRIIPANTNKLQIDVQNWAPGTYIIKQGNSTSRFVKE